MVKIGDMVVGGCVKRFMSHHCTNQIATLQTFISYLVSGKSKVWAPVRVSRPMYQNINCKGLDPLHMEDAQV